MNAMTHEQILEQVNRVRSGDIQAFAALVKSHEHMLLSFALYRLPQHEEALEAVQDSFIRAYEQLADFRTEADFGTWLRSICRYMILSRAKTYSRQKHKHDTYRMQIEALATQHMEQAEMPDSQQDLSLHLHHCTQQLSAQNQSLLNDRYTLKQSTQQISEKTGRTTTWVTSTLHRVRNALRTCIEHRIKESSNE